MPSTGNLAYDLLALPAQIQDGLANRTLVLQMLANESNRSAQFITILALAYSGGLKYFRGCLRWTYCNI